jgi:diphosphomevalonate decarboxylase
MKDITQGSITWQSPSNIAIVKYWGKYGRQLPRNTSISFTLQNAHTITELKYNKSLNSDDLPTVRVFFEGQENPKFGAKSQNFIHSILNEIPALKHYDYEIHTENTFPHSSGIASSASGMSALALCLCELELLVNGLPMVESEFKARASYLSRLGSGSACRSIYPLMASWGEHENIIDSSNEFATYCGDNIHEVFKTYHDDILIVSRAEKSVSSSAGHQLMEGNPYAVARYQQASDHISKLLSILKEGDVDAFGEIAEDEALTLHALMMCSSPSYILMEPETLTLINKIRDFRNRTKIPVYFTLDAGPNIHLLYPDYVADSVNKFIQEELKPHCKEILPDQVGMGSVRVSGD